MLNYYQDIYGLNLPDYYEKEGAYKAEEHG